MLKKEGGALIHSIRADGMLCDLSVASKINTDWHFLLYLRDLGREIADQWLIRTSRASADAPPWMCGLSFCNRLFKIALRVASTR